METLQTLPNIARLNTGIVRVLGQNPGKFTLQGTNTYLVGQRPPFILIDTGEGRDTYPPLLESALRSSISGDTSSLKSGSLVSDIVITHQHHDHFGGLPDVLKLLNKLYNEESAGSEYMRPRIHKYPLPAQFESTYEAEFHSILQSLPIDMFQSSPSGAPVHDLNAFQHLETSDGTISLEVLHTPGHTADSVCLLLRMSGADTSHSHVLFSADSVLGQGTAVFEDLGSYIRSLQQVLSLREKKDANAEFKEIYPGHGPVVDDGPSLIETYIRHRLEREAQIVDVLGGKAPHGQGKEGDSDGSSATWTIWNIVSQIYKDYPENLWLPAAHGVELHLKKLEGEGRARRLGGDGVDQQWALLSRL